MPTPLLNALGLDQRRAILWIDVSHTIWMSLISICRSDSIVGSLRRDRFSVRRRSLNEPHSGVHPGDTEGASAEGTNGLFYAVGELGCASVKYTIHAVARGLAHHPSGRPELYFFRLTKQKSGEERRESTIRSCAAVKQGQFSRSIVPLFLKCLSCLVR